MGDGAAGPDGEEGRREPAQLADVAMPDRVDPTMEAVQ